MKQAIESIVYFFAVILVLTGIAGVSYHLLREEGWIETMLGNIWNMEIQSSMIAVPVTIAAFIMFRLWHRNQVIHSSTSRLPNFFVYALMAGGVYFIGHYAVTGSL